MFSPDGAFINTSEILSDAEAQAIHNRVQDEVAAGNIADGRVGKFKNDPQFAAAKAYTDSEVSKRLTAAILQAEVEARAGQGDEDAADSLNDSEASATRLLEQYKGFVLSKLALSEKVQSQIRGLFQKYGWPTVWQSLDSIEGCEGGLNWGWQAVDDQLLLTLRRRELLKIEDLAEYIFIGMRASQCLAQYKALDKARPRGRDGGELEGEIQE
ncbi:uncharacterized protein J4E84_004536 [Alternaria hordeiaustralica]|uniref:uncharacterized protein n=1 Tax=Alternaria hordeiaustralica TaxID=1187925 RepID=UPI0020C3CB6D|nr:uncharacterized protein J4E84_004536 [Alternaria hordeiaustralica]KAI4688606.1 hypothetical protein J4E84_004536 [Alternaria hordeiaustralica]